MKYTKIIWKKVCSVRKTPVFKAKNEIQKQGDCFLTLLKCASVNFWPFRKQKVGLWFSFYNSCCLEATTVECGRPEAQLSWTIVSPFYTQRNSSKAEAMHLVRGERIRGIRIPPRGILEWPRAEAAKKSNCCIFLLHSYSGKNPSTSC